MRQEACYPIDIPNIGHFVVIDNTSLFYVYPSSRKWRIYELILNAKL